MSIHANGEFEWSDLLSSIDGVVEGLLTRLRVETPPVNAVQVMRRIGIVVRQPLVDGSKPEAQAKERTSSPSLSLQASIHTTRQIRIDGPLATHAREQGRRFERPARASSFGSRENLDAHGQQGWAAAIIGRWLAGAIFDSAGAGPEYRTLDLAMRLVTPFAARLLVPTRWFQDDVRRFGHDLARLSGRYSTATMEMVAGRLLDLEEPVVVTVFDNDHMVERRSNVDLGDRPTRLSPAERAAQAYAHTYSRSRLEHSPGVTARAWPQHRADWRREIVVSVLDGESVEIADWED